MSESEYQEFAGGMGPHAEAGAIAPGTIQAQHGNELDLSPPRGQTFPLVGIGGSAGGLDAFTRLLRALPENSGVTFVFVQHLDPHHESQLAEILSHNTTMLVQSVTDGMPVRPNEVFVIPPNTTMVLENGRLRLAQRKPGLHLPVDALFKSLAAVQGSRAIAVVLSGNASDGSQGVKAVKAECGLTFAQDEESAQHSGMPRNAIATGAIDYVLSPEEIARELAYVSNHPFLKAPRSNKAGKTGEELLPEGDGELKRIFQLLRTRTRVDFSHYKRNTVRRRIGRRMLVTRTKALGDYVKLLEGSPEEAHELYRDLLISVTNFFRDPEVFKSLRKLLREPVASRKADQPFRVWVPGCATGEEVYSLAICLAELASELQVQAPLQIFGTDISDVALDRARAATYPDLIAQDVSPERLARFFVRVDSGYHVSKQIRELCVFARQDIIQDAPFGNMDLVSCRNLLIYLDAEIQRRILPVFHYSLSPAGLLVLGSAESTTAASDLFSDADKQNRIYGRKPVPLRMTLNLSHRAGLDEEKAESSRGHITLGGIELQKKADLILQSKYTPAAVVIDSQFKILQFRGRTGIYLEPSPGEATFDLLRMAREPLTAPLRRIVDAANARNLSVRETGLVFEHRGERREIEIEVTPIAGVSQGERYFLVVFQEASIRQSDPAPGVPLQQENQGEYVSSIETQLRQLEKQNADLLENLRNVNEDHEAHSEELRAANEEVRSANEELQSTNEELSTTKEELQSTNEELTTLNEELQSRNKELSRVNSDLLNLLSAVDLPFLMLDNDLRLRRFSAAAEKSLGVTGMDLGSTLTNVEGRVPLAGLQPQMKQVLETLAVDHREIQDPEGRWFSVTIRPYRTIDGRITGIVIVVVDIDPMKRRAASSMTLAMDNGTRRGCGNF